MRRQSAVFFIASGLIAVQAPIEAKAQSAPGSDTTAQSTQQTPSPQEEATPLPALEVVAQSKKSKKAKPKPQAKAKAAPDTTAAAPAPKSTDDRSQAETATGPVKGYAASQSATGTKTDTPIIETPQGISVVGAKQMQEQKATDLQKALAYSSGIATGVVASNPATSDSFFIRGFQADPQYGSFYRDGMRYSARIFNGKQEPYGLERVEVLKGPASVLYGAAAPGGVINTVSKRPLQTPFREVNVEYGSNNRKQVSTDLSGPLDADGVWSYRLTAVGRDSDTFVDFGEDDTAYLAPALTWHPSSATSLTLLTSYHKMEVSSASTLPVVGTLLPNPNGQIARDRLIGEPDHNTFDNTTMTAAYLFEHKFSDALTFRHSLRGYRSELDSEYTLLAPVAGNVWADADQRLARRRLNKFEDETRMLTTDTNVESTFHTGDIWHKVLVGVDYADAEYHTKRWRGDLTPLDVFNPVYGATAALGFVDDYSDIQERTGLYFQDQIKIADRWVFLLGGRQDWMTYGEEDYRNPAATWSDNESAFTGRAGLVYLADNGLAPFFSYSESFEPTSGRDRNENRFDPTEGTQYEAGIRYQPKGTDTMVTASVYQLTRTNITTPDPTDPGFSIQTGEVRSRGIELEATTQVGQHLNLIAAYTYNDTRIVEGNSEAENGTRFPGIPYHVASLWVDYDLDAFGWSGWSVGAGARYVSDRPGSATRGALGTPAYTLIDARIGYEVGKWEYALNLSNLTDERYIPSVCYQFAVGCDYGAPMSAIATASYRW